MTCFRERSGSPCICCYSYPFSWRYSICQRAIFWGSVSWTPSVIKRKKYLLEKYLWPYTIQFITSNSSCLTLSSWIQLIIRVLFWVFAYSELSSEIIFPHVIWKKKPRTVGHRWILLLSTLKYILTCFLCYLFVNFSNFVWITRATMQKLYWKLLSKTHQKAPEYCCHGNRIQERNACGLQYQKDNCSSENLWFKNLKFVHLVAIFKQNNQKSIRTRKSFTKFLKQIISAQLAFDLCVPFAWGDYLGFSVMQCAWVIWHLTWMQINTP